ncbi:MAG: hypothetical protein ABSB66_09855 [Candidatus Acidiferrales bacterium]|jgi:hypothetical protein
MTKILSGVLIVALVFVFSAPAEAQKPNTVAPGAPHIGGVTNAEIVGIVVGVVVPVVVIAVVVMHHSARQRKITGCVVASPNGLTVNNERDNRVYALSGDTSGVKAGERMSLQGHKISPDAGNPLGWQVSQIQKDYGACEP